MACHILQNIPSSKTANIMASQSTPRVLILPNIALLITSVVSLLVWYPGRLMRQAISLLIIGLRILTSCALHLLKLAFSWVFGSLAKYWASCSTHNCKISMAGRRSSWVVLSWISVLYWWLYFAQSKNCQLCTSFIRQCSLMVLRQQVESPRVIPTLQNTTQRNIRLWSEQSGMWLKVWLSSGLQYTSYISPSHGYLSCTGLLPLILLPLLSASFGCPSLQSGSTLSKDTWNATRPFLKWLPSMVVKDTTSLINWWEEQQILRIKDLQPAVLSSLMTKILRKYHLFRSSGEINYRWEIW